MYKVPETPSLFLKYAEEFIMNDNSLLLVADKVNCIVGYIASKIEEKPPVYEEIRYGVIDNLAVLEDYQRQGLGELLFLETLSWFKEKDIHRLELMVTAGNRKSNIFWQKMGFETFMYVMGLEI